MAFASDLSINGGIPTAGTGSAKTFTVLSYPGPNKSTRIDTASTAAQPFTLEISHRGEGTGSGKRSVRSVTFRLKKLNATTADLIEGSVTLTARVPDDTTVALTDIADMLQRVANEFIANTTERDRFLRGEV